jgi:hypothetical protein
MIKITNHERKKKIKGCFLARDNTLKKKVRSFDQLIQWGKIQNIMNPCKSIKRKGQTDRKKAKAIIKKFMEEKARVAEQ